MDIIFRDILILYQVFFSSQVKLSVIVNNRDGIYELHYELSKDLKLRELGKIAKSLNL